MRACVRACVRVCVCVYVCMCEHVDLVIFLTLMNAIFSLKIGTRMLFRRSQKVMFMLNSLHNVTTPSLTLWK